MYQEAKASIVVGFTGTRKGMTLYQRQQLHELLVALQFHKFRHGDCVGADAQAHDLVRDRFPGKDIIAHPCTLSSQRAYKRADITCEPRAPLDRNQRIVDMSDIIIACPSGPTEELRSGTWATIRYARKLGKKLFILLP